MIFVEDSLNGLNETQVNESRMQEDLDLSNFLNKFQDVFIDDIPGDLPPKRGDDDHMIDLLPRSSPPNKPPYRVSQAQQEEIMRQVNELVEKGMILTTEKGRSIVLENEEVLVPEQILAHKDMKTKGKARRKFLVKFKNYPALDAKWMEEEDLADTPQIVKLYLEAFGLA
ncbi:hypothetical protein L7F22_034507 [Adiantum nelumboides]|nr:hypothetical protein [Adiantum nelumboides]